ncbi:hypothetical protein BBK82_45715 [Lentzea guizhouensis]|uniref:DUF1761 domain-containing protein n=1 Tax=Lentzea guizhouensis TaxID=1586287 RepID=A0A1B2HWP4_9PSEU|nr:DUF1761 domain-containing protein [Lentzea guizhouensis]ANZ42156.1 hypothetical protein BBK82_45715 [Lentzea guizhouensis]
MSLSVLGDLNWLAVLVATLAYYGLGAIWYAESVFGRAWRRSLGWDLTPPENTGHRVYTIPLATCFGATLATAVLGVATGTDNVLEGLLLGLVVGVGIAFPVMFVSGVFDTTKPAPKTFVAVGAGFHVIGLSLVGAILGQWR